MALPLAILLSSIMTFGNLGEHYELVAMKSAGISLKRIMLPLIILSVMISIGAFFFSNIVLPVANLKFKALLYDVRKQKLALNIQEGVFYTSIENFVIRVGKKEKDGNTIRDVMIYDHSDHMGNVKVTVAERGVMELTPDQSSLIFYLYNGHSYTEDFANAKYRQRRQFQQVKFTEDRKKFNLEGFAMNRTDEVFFKNNYQMMNLRQLQYAEDSLNKDMLTRQNEMYRSINARYSILTYADTTKKTDALKTSGKEFLGWMKKKDKAHLCEIAIESSRSAREFINNARSDWKERLNLIYKHKIVWHQKFTLSVACLLFFFIGAPLGAIIRKGGLGLPVVISAFMFIIFHIISITGEKYTKAGILPAWQGMWIAPLVLLPIGLFLTKKATTDSPLLDMETWDKLFRGFLPAKWFKKEVTK
jgi:lipopolysaccharide export system permease protein